MIKVKREEFLLELSRKTLASYIKKASGVIPSKTAWSLPDAKAARREVGEYGSPEWKKRHKKVISRMRGINQAADKLAKEEKLSERMESYVDAINTRADFNTLRRTKN